MAHEWQEVIKQKVSRYQRGNKMSQIDVGGGGWLAAPVKSHDKETTGLFLYLYETIFISGLLKKIVLKRTL